MADTTGFVGRDTEFQYAIALPNADPATLTFKRFGMMRAKTMDVAWTDADATGDTSPNFTKQYLVTFKDVTFSGDYVRTKLDEQNQRELIKHIHNPEAATDYQPYVWIKLTNPTEGSTLTGPFIMTTASTADPYDDVATGSLEGKSNGGVTLEYA